MRKELTNKMAFIDYYKIMGVPKDTPQDKMRDAYKRRAKQFHPDLHPNAPKAKAKFQALNEAYDVLSDPQKRAKYDQYGQNWKEADAYAQAGGTGSGQGGNGFDGFDFSQFEGTGEGGFSDFFEQLFGNFGSQRTRRSEFSNINANAEANVTIDMYTALLGGDIILQTRQGKLKLKVKPETQNGTKVRLRGKGYQKPDGTYGDLIIHYNVQLPTHLSEHQRQLLREMREG